MPTVEIESQWPFPGTFECVSLGARWNGWATPAFTLDQMRLVVIAMMAVGQDWREESVGDKPAFRSFIKGVPEEETEVLIQDADGLYRPDGWVWDEVEVDETPLLGVL